MRKFNFASKSLCGVSLVIAVVLFKFFASDIVLPLIAFIVSLIVVKKFLKQYASNYYISIIAQSTHFIWFLSAFILMIFLGNIYTYLMFDIILLMTGILMLLFYKFKIIPIIILLVYQIFALTSNIPALFTVIDRIALENDANGLVPLIIHIILRVSAIIFMVIPCIENNFIKNPNIILNADPNTGEILNTKNPNDIETKLNLIKKLYTDGLITEQEYNIKRKNILETLWTKVIKWK